MSRTYRKDIYHRTKNDYRIELEEWNKHPFWIIWFEMEIEQELSVFGTEAKSRGKPFAKIVKSHSNRSRKTFTKKELYKVYKDWEYEFDSSINKKLKGIQWWHN